MYAKLQAHMHEKTSPTAFNIGEIVFPRRSKDSRNPLLLRELGSQSFRGAKTKAHLQSKKLKQHGEPQTRNNDCTLNANLHFCSHRLTKIGPPFTGTQAKVIEETKSATMVARLLLWWAIQAELGTAAGGPARHGGVPNPPLLL